jgi:hypothetical protein
MNDDGMPKKFDREEYPVAQKTSEYGMKDVAQLVQVLLWTLAMVVNCLWSKLIWSKEATACVETLPSASTFIKIYSVTQFTIYGSLLICCIPLFLLTRCGKD